MTTFTIYRLNLPLVRPFRTSFGTETVRDVLLVSVQLPDGTVGWGECSTMSWPGYSAEYSEGAVDVMTRHLIPALTDVGVDPFDVATALEVVRGHPMAKSAIKTALLDAWLRGRHQSLADYLGAVRDRVDCGVSVGIPNSIPELLDEVGQYVDQGYRRIKLKIEPGWDLAAVEAVRATWPDIPLQVDANQAYTRGGIEHLKQLDPYGLLLIEQPLPEDDLVGHVQLAKAISTPVCLDESIISLATAEAALDFGATSIINIKPGRIGGYLTAKHIHDLCVERNVPVWCGGMLETGLGRAANIALAALPGFTLPGDTSGSDRYYRVDITEPFVLQDGQLPVPTGPGIGVEPIPEILEDFTVWRSEPIVPERK
jgi:O-succinylbenzoate synthase